MVAELTDAHHVVGSDGDTLYLRTERDAPRGRLVAVDLADAGRPVDARSSASTRPTCWSARSPAAGSFALLWSTDAAHRIEIVDRAGGHRDWPDLPAPVSVTAVNSRASSTEIFVGVTSFTRRARSLPARPWGEPGRRRDAAAAGSARSRCPTSAVERRARQVQRRGRRADDGAAPRRPAARSAADPAVRLRRVRHPGAAGVLGDVRRLGRRRRRAGGGQPARRRRVRRRLAPGRHAAPQAAGLRRPVRLRRGADRLRGARPRRSWPCTAGRTAGCWSARR